jgi:hypothetical protein
MKHPNSVLNNIMNRDTYVTGKCAIILAEILIKDFEKIYHNTQELKIKKFLDQTLTAIDRKVYLHLNMNNMSNLEIINLNDSFDFNENINYFFYKIDGLDNFIRGINNFSIITGIIEKNQIFCFNLYIPFINQMIWYQEESNLIYCNNSIIWSCKSLLKTNRIIPMINLYLTNNDIWPIINNNKFMITNNFLYDIFLLLNDSIEKVITNINFNPLEKILFNELIKIGSISIEEENNYKIIKKELIVTKTLN